MQTIETPKTDIKIPSRHHGGRGEQYSRLRGELFSKKILFKPKIEKV